MLEVTLTAEKVTKNTVRFREDAPESPDPLEPTPTIFPVIYIQKGALVALGSPNPDKIKVTVEVV